MVVFTSQFCDESIWETLKERTLVVDQEVRTQELVRKNFGATIGLDVTWEDHLSHFFNASTTLTAYIPLWARDRIISLYSLHVVGD